MRGDAIDAISVDLRARTCAIESSFIDSGAKTGTHTRRSCFTDQRPQTAQGE